MRPDFPAAPLGCNNPPLRRVFCWLSPFRFMAPFITGITFGLAIAIPVGPIGMLCLRRSLNEGRLAGFVSGLGAATADALYGTVAALGLSAVTEFLVAHHRALQLCGGLFLLYLGIAALRAKNAAKAATTAPVRNLWGDYASTFVLTAANPMTILTFLGFFASLGITVAAGPWAAGSLVAGVFLGSTLWWLVLSLTAGWLRGRLEHGGHRLLNLGSGLILTAFGAWQLLQFFVSGR